MRSEDPGLDVKHPQAAGIDIGNGAHYVAVRPDRDPLADSTSTTQLVAVAVLAVSSSTKTGAAFPPSGRSSSLERR